MVPCETLFKWAKTGFLVIEINFLLYTIPALNLSALVSDKTRRIWFSSQGWKPAVMTNKLGAEHFYCHLFYWDPRQKLLMIEKLSSNKFMTTLDLLIEYQTRQKYWSHCATAGWNIPTDPRWGVGTHFPYPRQSWESRWPTMKWKCECQR